MSTEGRHTEMLRKDNSYTTSGYIHRQPLLLSLLVLVAIMVPVLLCTDDYNPFTDVRNARAYLGASFSDGDTVNIFSTETLTVVLAVKELIDSFSLHAGSNRYFSDTQIVNGSERWPEGKSATFMVSFYDTGWQEISCVTRRQRGEEVVQRISCYARSPLKQASLIDTLGVPVCLSTAPVRDRDVVYFWAFGGGMVVQSVPHSVCREIPVNGVSTLGKLWVAELNGSHTSPPTLFYFSMFDEEGPEITCVNAGAVGMDTVVTASTEMYLQVQIVDGSGGRIFNATVNGVPFDIIREQIYLKAINTTGLPAAPEPFTVRAYDPFSNLTEKKLWVVYDSTARVTVPARITFVVPASDTTVVAKQRMVVYGRVSVAGVDSFTLAMECSVNSTTLPQRQTVRSVAGADWSFTVDLDEGRSNIAVRAYDSSETVVAEGSRVIVYDGEMTQENPPVIVDVLVDGRAVRKSPVTVDSSVAQLRIVAFDERSDIVRVLCNGQSVASAGGGDGVIWETPVSAAHTAEGGRTVLYVENGNGLFAVDTFFIRQNRDPVIEWYPQPPLPLRVGTPYTDTIFAIDPEGDPVRYKRSGGAATLLVDSVSGRISWLPTKANIGTDTVAITIQDPFDAQLYSFPVLVIDSSEVLNTITFVTTEEDFPPVLQAAHDTMLVSLQITSGTGRKPFRFSVRADGSITDPPVVENEIVRWTPQPADTGSHMLTVTVTDSFNNSAELFPHILVVPPNRPFSLSSRWTGDTTGQGFLLMFGASAPETLLVTVHDPDSGAADTISALLTVGTSADMPVPVVDRRISIPVAPRSDFAGFDTLELQVTDRAGHTEEVRFIVYYGAPPSVPQLIIPTVDSIVHDTTVRFEWSNSDPDGSSLDHTLYLAAGDTVLTAVADVQGTSTLTLEHMVRAGRYFWQIRSSDGIAETASDLQSFYIDPPLRVRFASGDEDIADLLRAETDTLHLALRLADGTGRAPYTLSVSGLPTTEAAVDNLTVQWIPHMADTGSFRVVITVQDSIGNRDTLSRMMRVLPPNGAPVLSLNHSVATTSSGALDLSSSTGPETLSFTASDADPPGTEQFIFHSLLRHTERIDDRGTERTFTVTVDPQEHPDQWFDTLTVWVEDREGLADTMEIILFYGYFPVTPRNPDPVDDSRNLDNLVILRWGPAAPVPDVFTYTVYLGTSEASVLPIESTTDTFMIVGSLVRGLQYYWRVSVTDGIDTVMGPVWSFYNQSADAVVTFNTTEAGVTTGEDVTGIPVMLRLDTSIITNLGGAVDMQPGGFLFMDARGDTIPYEIERWDRAGREMDVWILMDTVFTGREDQTVSVTYYPDENDSGSGPAVFGEYAGVWHMKFTSGGFPSSTYTDDASGNGHTGTLTGSGFGSEVTGIAGDAASILSNRYITVTGSQNIYSDEPFMIETWVMIPAGDLLSVEHQPLVVKGDYPPLLELDYTNRVFQFALGNASRGDWEYCPADSALELGRWYHICGRYDGAAATFFVNGIRQSTSLEVNSVETSSAPLYIGHHYDQPFRYFRGRLDEVRITPQARSDDWIRISFEGSNPDTRLFTLQRAP